VGRDVYHVRGTLREKASVADKYCADCGQELRADDRFCPGCGQPNTETARESTPQVDESVQPPPPAPQVEDAATPPAEHNEDTKPKEWWQTWTGRLGCATVIIIFVLAMVLINSNSAAPRILVGALVLVGMPFAMVLTLVAPIVFLFYRVASAVVGERATGHDDELISDDERLRLLEEATEISKQCFDYFKHFTTITTAAALVELALYNQFAINTQSARIGVIFGVAALAMTLLLCVTGLGLLSVGTALKGEFLEIGRFFRILMASTATFFLFGVVSFALTAVGPIFIETLKSIAQNIR
jgi:hypothetical protein